MSNKLGKYQLKGKLNKPIHANPLELIEQKQGFSYAVLDNVLRFKDYERRWGKIVVAVDSPNSWRKLVYPAYKANRLKKNLDADTYDKLSKDLLYKNMDTVLDILRDLGVIIIEKQKFQVEDLKTGYTSYGLEADDIIGALVIANPDDSHLIISNDGDFKQLVSANVRIYDGKEHRIMEPMLARLKEEWLVKTLIKGQKKDNIPNIKTNTLLHEDFVKVFNKKFNGANKDLYITADDTGLFNRDGLAQSPKIQKIVDDWIKDKVKIEAKEIADGKRVRANSWTIYAKPNFGDVAIKEFYKDYEKHLKADPKLMKNYKLNEKLFLMEKMPTFVFKMVEEAYDNIINSKRGLINIPKINSKLNTLQLSNCNQLLR